jgi:RHS repeat-associated protein
VANINYNAKGQRELIEYGNGVTTEYTYEDETFRLIRLLSRGAGGGPAEQNLQYTYDPVGNITHIRDDSQAVIHHNGEVVEPRSVYTYDALYRLIAAEGREHSGQAANNRPEDRPELKPHYDFNDSTRRNLDHPNDLQAMRNYTEQYEYDGVGNILAMIHQARGGEWTRRYDYAADSNRLLGTSLPGDAVGTYSARYTYDLHGNMTQMPHLPLMQWDFKDQLQASSKQVVNSGTRETTYYVYDASGQRLRKVTERQNGTPMKERIYLGGFELYREYNGSGNTLTKERETLHVMDGQQRIALVETQTFGEPDVITGNGPVANPLIRYQLNNHLGSACVELDEHGKLISYEEFYPYGSTAYQAGRSVAEVSLKRYRYTGMERDEETGLNYHTARYYAPWLGRWISCDPVGIVDGNNILLFSQNNPIQYIDKNGNDSIYFFRDQSGEWQHYQISSEGTDQYFYTTSMIEGNPVSDPSILTSIQRSSVEIPFPEFNPVSDNQTDIRTAQRQAESWYTDTPEKLHGEPENISAMARLVLSETGPRANSIDRLAVAEVIRNRAIMSEPGSQFSPHTYSQIVFSGAFPPAHGVAGQTINQNSAEAFLRPFHSSREQLIDSIKASLTAHFNESNIAQSSVWYPRDASGRGGTEVVIPGTNLERHRFFHFVRPGGEEWNYRPGTYTHSDAIGNRGEGLLIEEVLHRQAEEQRIQRLISQISVRYSERSPDLECQVCQVEPWNPDDLNIEQITQEYFIREYLINPSIGVFQR